MENGERRMHDKLISWGFVVIGALSSILWGITWGQVTESQRKVSTLEGNFKAVEVKLENIQSQLARIEKFLEKGEGR